MHLVLVASAVEGSAPSGIAENHAVVLKGAKRGLSGSTSASVDVGVAVAASLESSFNPILEAVCVFCLHGWCGC